MENARSVEQVERDALEEMVNIAGVDVPSSMRGFKVFCELTVQQESAHLDYEVLQTVRTLSSTRYDAFVDCLFETWEERVVARPMLGADTVQSRAARYEPGDYARAFLRVLEMESVGRVKHALRNIAETAESQIKSLEKETPRA